jgi:hypothetical protein
MWSLIVIDKLQGLNKSLRRKSSKKERKGRRENERNEGREGEREARKKKSAPDGGFYLKFLIQTSWKDKFHKTLYLLGNLPLYMHVRKSAAKQMKNILCHFLLC